MYDQLPSFVLGFHGCDEAVAERVFAGKTDLIPSTNDYDWLGHGIYFWENNPERAADYARMLQMSPRRRRPRVRKPAVIGAVIDLGSCLNLLDSLALKIVRKGYERLQQVTAKAQLAMPENRPVGSSKDLLLRTLDCAVIEYVHAARSAEGQQAFDSVRGVFVENASPTLRGLKGRHIIRFGSVLAGRSQREWRPRRTSVKSHDQVYSAATFGGWICQSQHQAESSTVQGPF